MEIEISRSSKPPDEIPKGPYIALENSRDKDCNDSKLFARFAPKAESALSSK